RQRTPPFGIATFGAIVSKDAADRIPRRRTELARADAGGVEEQKASLGRKGFGHFVRKFAAVSGARLSKPTPGRSDYLPATACSSTGNGPALWGPAAEADRWNHIHASQYFPRSSEHDPHPLKPA